MEPVEEAVGLGRVVFVLTLTTELRLQPFDGSVTVKV
jgi:hypothetical protein